MKVILRLHNIGELLTDGYFITTTEDGKNLDIELDSDDLVSRGYKATEEESK